MADRFLAGNGLTCPVCDGRGWVTEGRFCPPRPPRACRLPCPGGCVGGRLLKPLDQIIAETIAKPTSTRRPDPGRPSA